MKTILFILLPFFVFAQCEYTVVCGDTWGDTWSDGYIDYTVNDGSGNSVTGAISNTVNVPLPQRPLTSESTFIFSVPNGGSLDLDYFETSLITGTQYNEDNYIKVYYQGQLIFYHGDTSSIYNTISASDVISEFDDTTFNCAFILMDNNMIVLDGKRRNITPYKSVNYITISNKYKGVTCKLYSSEDGIYFNKINTFNGELRYIDINCYDSEYVYYKAVVALEGAFVESRIIVIKNSACEDSTYYYLDGRNGGSVPFCTENNILTK